MKRIEELADLCARRDIPTNTLFMDMHEQDLFLQVVNRRRARYVLSGGFPAAERRLAVFLPSYIDVDNINTDCSSEKRREDDPSVNSIFPFTCIEVAPISEKFAEQLSHRDYLGALMSLGIERNRIGDIFIDGKTAWFVCLDEIKDYLCGNLTSVRRTQVSCRECGWPEKLLSPKIEERTGSVSSERVDAVLALALRCPRSKAAEIIRDELVFRNGALVRSVSDVLRPGDIISVRHHGRLVYYGAEAASKKGRLIVRVGEYAR